MERRQLHQPDYVSNQSIEIELTSEQIEKYTRLVSFALEGKAYPYQSGYHVRAAALSINGEMHAGGNKEYGLSDAFIHGETAAISGLRDITASPIEAVAWYLKKDKPGPISESYARPCGNCRDVMLRYCDPSMALLTGNSEGIVFTRLSDFLHDDFDKIDTLNIDKLAVEIALGAVDSAVNIYLPEDLKRGVYGAALVSEDGATWMGSHYTNVGYDSITPVLSAVINWRNSYPLGTVSEKHLKLSKLVLASYGNMPKPFYRDRQAILELDEILRRYTGSKTPLPVEIVDASRITNGTVFVSSACSTDVEKWLPHPFTPGAFRMDDVMEAQLAQLVGSEL
ncbi:MAG: hypothetical protein HYV90_04940 [Candidatus Woesebacteria bacterium]|nr:MAG: hypothetical protein HYV90_04940 [Candidatus Woesebacteria bacterium]